MNELEMKVTMFILKNVRDFSILNSIIQHQKTQKGKKVNVYCTVSINIVPWMECEGIGI